MDGVSCNGGSRLVVTELSHIKQLVTQLDVHLGESPDLCKRLASQIFSLIERSIGIITSSSPVSDVVVDAPFKTNKKRKTMEKRMHQVRVSPGGGGGGGETVPVDDGHSWRKYGQKEILGAKHPRGYYRCTHRHSRGCAATKQVQRSDEDPELFDVIYLGTHTCVHKAAAAAAGQATQTPEYNAGAHGLLQNLSANLTVKTDGLDVAAEPQGWSTTAPFVFSSTPVSAGLTPELSPAFEAAAGDAEWWTQAELQEVVSALMVPTGKPAVPAVDIDDDFLNIDISSYFV